MTGARQPPDWLVARPIAHRGLHERAAGVVENSPAAARAAIERGFAVECDVQLTRDGNAVVFHDFTLERLTAAAGAVAERSAAELTGLELRGSTDRIPTLDALLGQLAGRVPLVCEVKSRFDGDVRLADRVAAAAAAYPGPLAIKSFDPAVVAHLRGLDLPNPLGLVAQADHSDPSWGALQAGTRQGFAGFLHYADTRPDFLSYRVDDLPHAVPHLFRAALGLPVMGWTVRTPDQRQRAARWADQMVFEGFTP